MTGKILRPVILLILAGLIIRVLFFTVSVNSINVSGDESIYALQSTLITQNADSPVFKAKQHPPGVFGRFPLLFMAQPYLFPLESYLSAALMPLLPYSAAGVRFPILLMGLLTCILSIRLLGTWGRFKATWPGWVLLLIPSPYLMIFLAAYAPPSYPSLLMFTPLVLWLSLKSGAASSRHAVWAGLTGFAGGLICSGTLLAAPLLGVAALLTVSKKSGRECILSGVSYAAGTVVGFAPHWYARLLYPGSYDAVSGFVSMKEALSRLWDPAITFSVPLTLGYRTTIIPDAADTAGFLPVSGSGAAGVLWTVLLLVSVAACIFHFFRRWKIKRHPSFCLQDALVVLSIASIGLFIFSNRFGAGECRYLLPLALCLPMLLTWLHVIAGRKLRLVTASLAVGWAVLNVGTSAALLSWWSAPDFDGHFNDSRPVVAYLRSQEIQHCYASYFDAYAISYLSSEQVMCSQPFNERFQSWPLPYKDEVDAATNVVFVLGPSHRFRAEHFESDMENMKITYRKEPVGPFQVYSDFVPEDPDAYQSTRVTVPYVVRVSEHTGVVMKVLSDGNYVSRWHSAKHHAAGDFIEIEFESATHVDRIALYYNYDYGSRPRSFDVKAFQHGEWVTVSADVPADLKVVEFRNGHPVFGNQYHEVMFPPVETDRLRIQVVEPDPERIWTLGEVVPFASKQ